MNAVPHTDRGGEGEVALDGFLAPSSPLARLLTTLELEAHGRLSGRDRLASVFAPDGSVAVVSPELATSVLRGLWEADRG